MHINPFVDILYIHIYCMQSRALFENISQFCTFLPRFFNPILITHFILYIYILYILYAYILYIYYILNVFGM